MKRIRTATWLLALALFAAAPAWAQTTNQLTMSGAPSGSQPSVRANGVDANISIILTTKGTGGVGIGTSSPQSTLSINGGVAVGTTYAGTNAAASNNLIVQGSVGIGTPTPNTGAVLDAGQNTTSIILPVGSSAQRPGVPYSGMMRYNSDTNLIEFFNGTGWNYITQSASSPAAGCGGNSGTLSSQQQVTITVTGGCAVTFKVWGAGGAAGQGDVNAGANGGGGGYATIIVTPSVTTTYYLVVGGGGVGGGVLTNNGGAGLSGYTGGNGGVGGGSNGTNAGGGGAASSIWTSSYGGTAVVVAAGGGGGSGIAQNYYNYTPGGVGYVGGAWSSQNSSSLGGNGTTGSVGNAGGGGGGAGYVYGGSGGGINGSGSGGVNYAASGGSTATGTGTNPGNAGDGNRPSNAGNGGTGVTNANGNNGNDGAIYYSW